ncbi:MAG TPA: TadE family protein [Microbacteriaceae bacterium]|nr:TadE family protein [Microbacteriaceae bacterium]
MRSARRLSERGSVSAEFAVALPAAVLVLMLCMNGLFAAALRIELASTAATAARRVARGEPREESLAALQPAEVSIGRDGELICVTAARQLGIARIVARSCALDDAE